MALSASERAAGMCGSMPVLAQMTWPGNNTAAKWSKAGAGVLPGIVFDVSRRNLAIAMRSVTPPDLGKESGLARER